VDLGAISSGTLSGPMVLGVYIYIVY